MAGTPIEILIKALGAEQVVAALKKVNAENMTVKKTATEAGAALDTIGTKSKGPLGSLQTSLAGASRSTTEFSGALRNTNPSLHDFNTSFQNAASGAPKYTSSLQQASTSTKSLSESGKQLATSFQAQVGAFSAVAGSAISLFEAYDAM